MTALQIMAILAAKDDEAASAAGTIRIRSAGFDAICRPAPDFSTPECARAALMAQHELLVRIAARHDLVPVRVGAIFSGPAAVAAHLRDAGPTLSPLLARIAGCVEMVVTTRPAPAVPPSAAAGRTGLAYLRDRRPGAADATIRSAAAALADEVLHCVAPLIRAVAPPGPAAQAGLATLALLSPRTQVTALRAAIAPLALRVAAAGGAVTIDGPWPCYSFLAAEDLDVPA